MSLPNQTISKISSLLVDESKAPEFGIQNRTVSALSSTSMDILDSIPKFNQEATSEQVSRSLFKDLDNERIMYVHVGKTGGTTLEVVLRASCEYYDANRNRVRRCLELQQKRSDGEFMESVLSRHVMSTLHMNPKRPYKWWIRNTTSFLVTARNPITRLVSAFNYAHITNIKKRHTDAKISFYRECFNEVEEFAQLLYRQLQGEKDFTPLERKCLELAKSTILGQGSPDSVGHLFYNYGYYANITFGLYPERKLYVLRTEQIWADLMKLESNLGGNGYVSFKNLAGTRFKLGSEFSINSGLSPSGVRAVCCYSAKENMIYEFLIRHGVNLDETEKKEALEALYELCEVGDRGVIDTYNQDGYSNENAAFDWEGWARQSCFAASSMSLSSQ